MPQSNDSSRSDDDEWRTMVVGAVNGDEKLLAKRSIRALREVIQAGEVPEAFVKGSVFPGGFGDYVFALFALLSGIVDFWRGFVVVTDRRLIYIDRQPWGGMRIESHRYDRTSYVFFTRGLWAARLEVCVDGVEQRYGFVNKRRGTKFAAHLIAKLDEC